MLLRKINAWLSLVTTVFFFDHAIYNALWMLSKGRFAKNATIMPFVLFGLMMLHALLSIILVLLSHETTQKRKCKGYFKENKESYLQRISGFLLIFLTVMHVAGVVGIVQPSQFVHAVLPPVFFAVCMMHVGISTNKAFITLGIGNAKFIKISGIVIRVLCITTYIADIVGFYLFVC